jgi:hypothetical protein
LQLSQIHLIRSALSTVRCRAASTQDTDVGSGGSIMFMIIMSIFVQADVYVDEKPRSFFGEYNVILLQEFLFQTMTMLRQQTTMLTSNNVVDTGLMLVWLL